MTKKSFFKLLKIRVFQHRRIILGQFSKEPFYLRVKNALQPLFLTTENIWCYEKMLKEKMLKVLRGPFIFKSESHKHKKESNTCSKESSSAAVGVCNFTNWSRRAALTQNSLSGHRKDEKSLRYSRVFVAAAENERVWCRTRQRFTRPRFTNTNNKNKHVTHL